MSKRALDNFIGSPRNLSGSKTSLEEQTVHGEKWTLTPGCKGSIWARRGCHHTKRVCVARIREFLMRAAEADAWKKPASSTEPARSTESPSSARPSGSAREEGVQPEPVDEHSLPTWQQTRRRQTLKRRGGCGS